MQSWHVSLVQVQRGDVVLFEGLGEGTEILKFEEGTPTPVLYNDCPNSFFLSIDLFNFRRVFDKSLADTRDPTTMWLFRFRADKMAWFAKFAVIELMLFTISWRKRAGALEISIIPFVYSGPPVVRVLVVWCSFSKLMAEFRAILTKWPQTCSISFWMLISKKQIGHTPRNGCFWVFPQVFEHPTKAILWCLMVFWALKKWKCFLVEQGTLSCFIKISKLG